MALKIVRDPKLFKAALFEYEIARSLSHPNICTMLAWFAAPMIVIPTLAFHFAFRWTLLLFDACLSLKACCLSFRASSTEFVLVQEYAPNGDLLSSLKPTGSLPDASITRSFSQVVRILLSS